MALGPAWRYRSSRRKLRGYVDHAGPVRVCGWAQDCGRPEEPVALDVLVSGVMVARVLANAFRVDLRKAGLGSGCHAFDLDLPAGVVGPVTVRRIVDGAQVAHARVADVQDYEMAV